MGFPGELRAGDLRGRERVGRENKARPPVPGGAPSTSPEPTDEDDFYITDFSSRELTGQDLDVAAPGSWVVGPFQLQRGQTSFFFLGGTPWRRPM